MGASYRSQIMQWRRSSSMKNNKPAILSLFDYSGVWSNPYKDNGFEVYQIDIKYDIDILDLSKKDIVNDNIYGILAAPPCTDFASSGARWWSDKDIDGRTEYSIKLMRKTLDIINWFNPKFWALENPVGRLNKLIPELINYGPWYFNPNEFAGYLSGEEALEESYTKKTGLWGLFNKPVKKPMPPILGSKMHTKYGGKSERTKELRSVTPKGFAQAFYISNH